MLCHRLFPRGFFDRFKPVEENPCERGFRNGKQFIRHVFERLGVELVLIDVVEEFRRRSEGGSAAVAVALDESVEQLRALVAALGLLKTGEDVLAADLAGGNGASAIGDGGPD